MHVLRELLALLHELLLSAEELQHLLRAGLTVLVQLLQSDKTQTDETNYQTELHKGSLGLAVFQQHVLNFRMLVERRAELVSDFADICQNLLSVKGSFSQSEIHPKFLSLFRCFIS